MENRRVCRITGFARGYAGAAPQPLQNSNATNVPAILLDRKRRADASSDVVLDAKRATTSGGYRPQPSRVKQNASAAAGCMMSLQQATPARAGGNHLQPVSENAPAADVTCGEIIEPVQQSTEDVLNKKISFPRALTPKCQLEQPVPMHNEYACIQGEVDRKEMEPQDQETLTLREELKEAECKLAAKEALIASMQLQLQGLQAQLEQKDRLVKEQNGKIYKMEEVANKDHKYAANVQPRNTSLHAGLPSEKGQIDEMPRRATVGLKGLAAKLGGKALSSEQQELPNEQMMPGPVESCIHHAGREILHAQRVDLRADRDALRSGRDVLAAQRAQLRTERCALKEKRAAMRT